MQIIAYVRQGVLNMLVLNRNIGETIVVDNDIHVKVIGIRGGQVRLGIEAPKNVDVHREEIYQKIQAQLLAEASKKDDDSEAAA